MTWKPEIKWVPIESVIEYARNPKKHPEAQIQKLAASIHANGFTVPLLVSKDMVIAAGHGRLQAAKSLRMAEVPVIVADHLDEHQLAAYRIMDNKVASLGEWDEDFLKFELGSLDLRGLDLSLTGFDLPELDTLLADASAPDTGTSNASPSQEVAQQRVQVSGDAYRIGTHRLECGENQSAAWLLTQFFNHTGVDPIRERDGKRWSDVVTHESQTI